MLRASFRSKRFFINFDFFRDILTILVYGCQLFGRFDLLNALAGLPNEPRNVPCATGHLLDPLGPATAQRRPTFFHGRIFALLGLRGRFEIILKSGSLINMA